MASWALKRALWASAPVLYWVHDAHQSAAAKHGRAATAVAVLGPVPHQSDSGVRGSVRFVQPLEGDHAPVKILVELSGLQPGKHGFHVHALGDLTSGCSSAGGHFNPLGKTHGGPADSERHVGDLGNLVADETGRVSVVFEDATISLRGPHNIVGRTLIVHADEDDLGRGGFPDSKTTGHAGSRVSCGVVGLGEEVQLQ